MSAHQKQGQAVIKSVLTRLFFLSMPASVITHVMPNILTAGPLSQLSPTQIFLGNAVAAAIAGFSLLALFKPKLLIKPLIGAALFFFVSYMMTSFGYKGPYYKPIKDLIIISAGLAAAYLVFFDTIRMMQGLYAKLQRKFSPSQIPSWAGPFNSTQEKGDALEFYVRDLYKKLYGNAMTTTEMKERGLIPNGPGDQGADVIVELPGGRRLAIQCKNVESPMGNSAVQEIMAAKAYYNATDLAIVSPKGFTDRCVELAQMQGSHYKLKIDLIDGLRLDELNRASKLRAA